MDKKIHELFEKWFDKGTNDAERIFSDKYPWEQEDTGNQMNLAAQAFYAGFQMGTEQANQPDSQYDLGGLILPGSMWAEPK